MSKSFLLKLALFVMTLSIVANFAATRVGNTMIEKALETELNDSLHRNLENIVLSTRGDLLNGNLRGAKYNLIRLIADDQFWGFRIAPNDAAPLDSENIDEDKVNKSTKTKVPVYFSNLTRDKAWGYVEFYSTRDSVRQLIAQLNRNQIQNMVFVAFVTLFSLLIGFSILFIAARSLGQILDKFARTEILGKPPRHVSMIWQPLIQTLRVTSERASENRNHLEETRKYESIARTTTMLAHDVRKPFTMLQMLMNMLTKAKTLDDVHAVTTASLPELERSLADVNGLIQDVMEIGSTSIVLNTEQTTPESLIEMTLLETFRVVEDSPIIFEYELQHKHKVNVDTYKVKRVFANIVGNAAQALRDGGSKIWFKTKNASENHERFIHFVIGNNGPSTADS